MKHSKTQCKLESLMSPTAGFMYALMAFLAILLIWTSPLNAQQNMTLYHMPGIPQSYNLNPGKIPLVKGYLGIPALSGTHMNIQSDNLNYSTVKEAMDSPHHNFDIGALHDNLDGVHPNLKAEINLKAFSFGARTGSGFIQLEVSEQILSDARFSNDMVRLFGQLQHERPFANGTEYSFDDTDLSGSYIRSYSLGYSHAVSPSISAGFRAHYLEGLAMIQTINDGLGFKHRNNKDAFEILGKMDFMAAGAKHLDEFDPKYLIPGNKPGNGYAIDLGMSIVLGNFLELSFSALNLGQMTWKKELSSATLSASSPFADKFQKYDLESFNEGWDGLLDALSAEHGDIPEEKIKQTMPTRFFAGAQILLGDRSSLGGVLEARHTEFTGTKWGIGASFNTRIGKILGLSAALTHSEFEAMGLGLGAHVDIGPIQVYAVTDNAFAALDYKNATMASAQIGLNFTFGKLVRSEQYAHYYAKQEARKAKKYVAID